MPFLKSLEARIRAGGKAQNVDDAIAISLNLTSYVSTLRPKGKIIHCVWGFSPMDAVDKVIRGRLIGMEAVGYKFLGYDRWSENSPGVEEQEFSLDTIFYNADGQVCGEMPISFRRSIDGNGSHNLNVDQGNIVNVQKLTLKCARQPA